MVEGNSIRSLTRMTGVSKGAVLRLLPEVGDDFVEAAVLADVGEFFEGGLVVERRVLRIRHRSGPGRQLGDDGLHEVSASCAGNGDLRFQRVHQGHQLLHFGDDPALFGEGGKWCRKSS
jgi:hypothetical protein